MTSELHLLEESRSSIDVYKSPEFRHSLRPTGKDTRQLCEPIIEEKAL